MPHKRIDHFRVDRKIGGGAQGTVYAGIDMRLQRPVALKIMGLGAGMDARSQDRFIREARLLAKVDHPSVVRVYHVGRSHSGAYYAMEYLTGGTLEERLVAETPFGEPATVQLMRDTLGGLGAAHDVGIIHRDVKPGNILFTEDGRAKLCDFGLVLDEHDARLTKTNALLGTPHYVAPECWRGQTPTATADLFAMGVVLYRCLSRRVPFEAESVFALSRAICEQIVDYGSLEGLEYAAEWQELLQALLAKAPADRPESAWEALNQLNRLLPAGRVPTLHESQPPEGGDSAWDDIDSSAEVSGKTEMLSAEESAGAMFARSAPAGTEPDAAAAHDTVVRAPKSRARSTRKLADDDGTFLTVEALPLDLSEAPTRTSRWLVRGTLMGAGLAGALSAWLALGLVRARQHSSQFERSIAQAQEQLASVDAERGRLSAENIALQGQVATLLNRLLPKSEPIYWDLPVTMMVDSLLCEFTFTRPEGNARRLTVDAKLTNLGEAPPAGQLEVGVYDEVGEALGTVTFDIVGGAVTLTQGKPQHMGAFLPLPSPDVRPVRYTARIRP